MKQKRKWFLSSATNDVDLSEINFKEELLDVNGEPKAEIVDFYDGRLIPQPSVGETYLKRSNEKVRMLVTGVAEGKVEYMEHDYPVGREQQIKDFLEKFKLEKL